jgi:hypothetical protein
MKLEFYKSSYFLNYFDTSLSISQVLNNFHIILSDLMSFSVIEFRQEDTLKLCNSAFLASFETFLGPNPSH